MDQETRKAYQDRLAARIKEWEAKVDQLAARAHRAEADLRVKLKDEESELRKRLDEARSRLDDLKSTSGESWKEIRAGAEKLWEEMREAWNRAGGGSGKDSPGPDGGSAGPRDGDS
jgi:uncharacterized coiled-coil DUF342 family protein